MPESSDSASLEWGTEAYNYYPTLEKVEAVCVGDGFGEENKDVFVLSEEELSTFWKLLRINGWEVAMDLKAMGYTPDFYIRESEQIWFFNQYKGKTLVVPSFPDAKGEKICYYAPGDVISDVIAYMETLTPVP